MAGIIERQYDFLLADPEADPDYTEGNIPYGDPIFGTASQMRDRFLELFGNPSSTCKSLGAYPIWDVDGTEVLFLSRCDRELPNKPECYGHLRVKGELESVDAVCARVEDRFEGIDKHVHERKMVP